ncbi:MAG: hypothetical protein M1481_04085 [Candidatus Thermoplasmatota archaeon]|nr:hypothetical protein [Candidatus Thermoplasmatota archaeon]MCL5963194.1 hypothetical protein [Candidatus Thermoplasmatota archaeon]
MDENKILWIMLGIFAIVVVAAIAMTFMPVVSGGGYYGGMGGMMGAGWGFGIVFMIVPLLFFILLVYFITTIISEPKVIHHYEHDQHGYHGSRAVEIAEERFARGEITKEQLESIRTELQKR